MDIRMLKNKFVFFFIFIFCFGLVGICFGMIFVVLLVCDKNFIKDEIVIIIVLVSGFEFIFWIVLGFVVDMNIVERYCIV